MDIPETNMFSVFQEEELWESLSGIMEMIGDIMEDYFDDDEEDGATMDMKGGAIEDTNPLSYEVLKTQEKHIKKYSVHGREIRIRVKALDKDLEYTAIIR